MNPVNVISEVVNRLKKDTIIVDTCGLVTVLTPNLLASRAIEAALKKEFFLSNTFKVLQTKAFCYVLKHFADAQVKADLLFTLDFSQLKLTKLAQYVSRHLQLSQGEHLVNDGDIKPFQFGYAKTNKGNVCSLYYPVQIKYADFSF